MLAFILWLLSIVGFIAYIMFLETFLPIAWQLAKGQPLSQIIESIVKKAK